MTGSLTTQGRWKAGLLRICSGAEVGSGCGEHFCVHAPVPETEILDSDFPHVRTLGSDWNIEYFHLQTLYIHSDWCSSHLCYKFHQVISRKFREFKGKKTNLEYFVLREDLLEKGVEFLLFPNL